MDKGVGMVGGEQEGRSDAPSTGLHAGPGGPCGQATSYERRTSNRCRWQKPMPCPHAVEVGWGWGQLPKLPGEPSDLGGVSAHFPQHHRGS